MSEGVSIMTSFPAEIYGVVVNITQTRNIMKQWIPSVSDAVQNLWPGKVSTSVDIRCKDGSLFKEVPIDDDCNCKHLHNDYLIILEYQRDTSSYDIVKHTKGAVNG